MAIRNNHWYNLNEQRDYPVDDVASAISDNGDRLPSSLIADLRLRWPSELGRYAFISAAAVTSGLVTVMIETSKTANNSPNTATLLAGISVPKSDLVQGRTYILETFQDKVGGFITFGSGSEENFSGRFSSPEQTLLTARAARSIRQPPIPSIQINQSSEKLTGIVNFSNAAPLSLTKETRVIDGVEFDNVLVFRLVEEANRGTADSVFSEFAGDCGKRTGSRTCSNPQPLETINGIAPDCDGIITLDLKGCSVVGRNVSDCGVIVDCGLGLSSSCEPAPLPNLTTGKLPSEIAPIIIPPTIPPEPPVNPDVSISESATTVLSLPYCDRFDDGVAYGFSLVGESSFGFIADDSPGEEYCCSGPPEAQSTGATDGCAVSQSVSVSGGWEKEPILEVASSYGPITTAGLLGTNISLFTSDVQCLFRKYTTDVKIRYNPYDDNSSYASPPENNAGILLNYRLTSSNVPNYYVARLDIVTSTFGIFFFNGASLVQVAAVQLPDVRNGDWYRITFAGVPTASQTSINLTATVEGVTDGTISATVNSTVTSSSFGQDSGLAGLHNTRSYSTFSFWRIDEVTA